MKTTHHGERGGHGGTSDWPLWYSPCPPWFILVLALAMLLVAGLVQADSADAPRPFLRGSLDEIAAARAGRPFVLKLWSLDCPPCRAELPAWGSVIEHHPAVELVLVSVDGIEAAAEVHAALAEAGLGARESWVFADPFVERLRLDIDPAWRGELPRTLFYDTRHEVRAVSGRIHKDELERWLCEQSDAC
jgi:thiol-disulfide isomerase/thioredoxin